MKKILFIKLGEFSNINRSIELQLRAHFPDYELEIFNLEPLIKKDRLLLAISGLALLIEYFVDFLAGHKNIRHLKRYYYNTSFIIRFFNKQIEDYLTHNEFEFIVQTQSLFNSGNRKIPNFIYTDNTALNNLNFSLINPKEFSFSRRYIAMEKQIYKDASMVFVMSNNIRESLSTQYGISSSKIKLIFAGSNTQINETINKEKYFSKNILFVGKHWERKGGPLLIEAFKLVQQAVPNATLTILGCTPSISVRNCTIVGKVPLSIVAYHYNNASVFCLPTKREPFGIVFIEAMLNRLPIVTNTVGATPELVFNGENGYLVNYNPEEYAKVLISLLESPEKCEKFGERSFRIANQNYTWKNTGVLFSKYIKDYLNWNGQ